MLLPNNIVAFCSQEFGLSQEQRESCKVFIPRCKMTRRQMFEAILNTFFSTLRCVSYSILYICEEGYSVINSILPTDRCYPPSELYLVWLSDFALVVDARERYPHADRVSFFSVYHLKFVFAITVSHPTTVLYILMVIKIS